MASVEEEEAPLESVSYDDEEDEDDDILKPVFTKKNSSPISKSSVIASSPLISPNYAADVTQESIEERGRSLVWIDGQIIQLIHAQTHHPNPYDPPTARAAAQRNLKYQRSDYSGLSLSDFYWKVHNNNECYSFPCHIVNDFKGFGVKPRKGQVAVRYIGSSDLFRPAKSKSCFAIVARKQLVPYTTKTSSAADAGDDSSMTITAAASSSSPKWCPQRMQQLRERVLQNDDATDSKLRDEFLKESIYLDCVLEFVVQLQEEEESQLLVSQQVTMESEEDSSSSSEDENECNKEQEDMVEEDGSNAAPPEQQEPPKRSVAVALPPQPSTKRKLTIRAGDVIMYRYVTWQIDGSCIRLSSCPSRSATPAPQKPLLKLAVGGHPLSRLYGATRSVQRSIYSMAPISPAIAALSCCEDSFTTNSRKQPTNRMYGGI